MTGYLLMREKKGREEGWLKQCGQRVIAFPVSLHHEDALLIKVWKSFSDPDKLGRLTHFSFSPWKTVNSL